MSLWTTLRSPIKALRRASGKRSPAGPTGMMNGITSFSTGDPPEVGTQELLEAYESTPWLRAVSSKVSFAVAWCFVPLLMSVRRGGKHVREKSLAAAPFETRGKRLEALRDAGQLVDVSDHIFLDALERPNPYMSRLQLLKLSQLYADLVGDFYWIKERNRAGAPVGFWPVPPHWVLEHPTPARPAFRIGYRSWQVVIPQKEIVWHHEPALAQPYGRGSGIGWSLGDEIEVDEYAAKMAKALFWNRARPDFLFMGGPGSDPAEMKRLERDWNNRLQGFWRSHKPYFMAGGNDDVKKHIYEFQQPTMEQLTYPNMRTLARDTMFQSWGTPPEIFGIFQGGTLSRVAYEAAEYIFLRWVVLVRMEPLRLTLQAMIEDEYDDRLLLDYPNPIPDDKAHGLNVMKAAPSAFLMDEFRRAAGLRPDPEHGKARIVPLNVYVTDDPIDLEKRPKGGAAPPAAEDDGKKEDDDKKAASGGE